MASSRVREKEINKSTRTQRQLYPDMQLGSCKLPIVGDLDVVIGHQIRTGNTVKSVLVIRAPGA